MRDADTPPQEPTDGFSHPAALTPQQRADLIRAAAAEVRERVQAWRDSPNWRSTPANSHRYKTTLGAIDGLGQPPDVGTEEAVARLVDAVHPVIVEWRPSRPGSEQSIYVAVERLRRLIDASV
ncbi:hypothetical protein AB0M37_27055 [Micromonospora chalcea]